MERGVYCIQAIRRHRDYSRKRRASSPRRSEDARDRRIRGTMSRLAEWLSALGTWGTRLARDLADERLLRSAIRELHQLDDRMLADIGITRGEVESAVRNGLPTRLTHNLRQHAASGTIGMPH